MPNKNSASQILAFLLIPFPKLLPEFILLHKSKLTDFVTVATDSQEAASCHLGKPVLQCSQTF